MSPANTNGITDQCHIHNHSNRTTLQLGPRQYTRAPTDSHKAASAQPPHQLGSPQRKPTVSLPSMCFSVPLAHGREMPAACLQAPHSCFLLIEALYNELSPSLFSTLPPPQIHKRGLQNRDSFFLYRNKRLAFLPFCFPTLGLNLANGKRVEAV